MVRSVGEIIDALGVKLDLSATQQLTDVIVVGRVVDFEDGNTGLMIGSSDGLDWILELGLLTAARQILGAQPATCEGED
jgi:hypothetical protein